LNLSGKSFGFCYESDGFGRIFSENEEKISDDLLFEIAQIFSHQLVFEESGKIYMKPVEDEEVISLESLTALTDLERLADGRKRLKGYSQEDL
ncbi:cystathionine beta-lyase, partial [Klebsiella pneumoniae]|nr:cystathionine beta-lyase [Klebsiella pneumoniae]